MVIIEITDKVGGILSSNGKMEEFSVDILANQPLFPKCLFLENSFFEEEFVQGFLERNFLEEILYEGKTFDRINGVLHFGDGGLDKTEMLFVLDFESRFVAFKFLQSIKAGELGKLLVEDFVTITKLDLS